MIPPRWTLRDYDLHNCSDRSHFHFSKSEYDEQLRDGSVELVRMPDRRRGQKAIVRIVRIAKRGLSCSAGTELAMMMTEDDSRPIAQTMLAEIQMRREAPSEELRCTA